jgi:DNA primase small subunit
MNLDKSIQQSLDFLKTNFQQYYKKKRIQLPDRFTRREFAFILFGGKGMLRHLAFNKKEQCEHFLQKRVPQHAYYSSAYYQIPDAPTMQEKRWMGAELIFDLDSDHLPNADQMTYTEQLYSVKQEFQKLVYEFLLDDFGFKKNYLDLYFSGGRGYHCHVKDPAIFDLDSNERREIVDYITARDLRDSIIFRERTTGAKRYGRRSFPVGKSLQMPTPDQTGWKGRISRGIIDLVNDIISADDPKKKLLDYGVKENDAEKLLSELSEQRVQRIKDGLLDQSKTIRKFFLNNALRKTAVSLTAGETDEPVTCDVKRLIRLPDSLHGKTGFQVVQIDINKLDEFNPLCDTVVFSDEPIKVNLRQQVSITLKEQTFSLKRGVHEIPTFLAVFLVGMKKAVLT